MPCVCCAFGNVFYTVIVVFFVVVIITISIIRIAMMESDLQSLHIQQVPKATFVEIIHHGLKFKKVEKYKCPLPSNFSSLAT